MGQIRLQSKRKPVSHWRLSRRLLPNAFRSLGSVEGGIWTPTQNARQVGISRVAGVCDSCVEEAVSIDHGQSPETDSCVISRYPGTTLREDADQQGTTSVGECAADENVPDYQVDNHEASVDRNARRVAESNLVGYQIVDLTAFLEQLHQKFDNHNPRSACPFSCLKQVGSRRYGLRTQISFVCERCGYQDYVWTDRNDENTMDINRLAVAGATAIGIGHSQMEQFLGSMNIACMAGNTYTKHELELVNVFSQAAAIEMEEAGKASAELAIRDGNYLMRDGKKIPVIDVVADGTWGKRSYGTKYDSLSGAAAIVCRRTQKILFVGVRNKFCAVCDWAARHEKRPRDHTCFKNWGRDQASTGMEKDAIVEGFQLSMEMHGIIYGTLIADGDSSVYKSILDTDPYREYGVMVEKIECVNHLFRNLSRKIREVAKTRGRGISNQKKMVHNSSLEFRRAIQSAIVHRQNAVANGSGKSEQIALLKSDVQHIPHHVFGDHTKCIESRGFCDGTGYEEQENVVASLTSAGLFDQLMDITMHLSIHASSLFVGAKNNTAESYNALIAKSVGGKRINFGMRGSYQSRCLGSVVQHNSGALMTKLNESQKKIVPERTRIIEVRRRRKILNNRRLRAERQADPEQQRKSHTRARGADENYGVNARKPDMSNVDYAEACQDLMTRLLQQQANRDEIERETREQAALHRWKQIRSKMLTASHFGKVCRLKQTTPTAATVRAILYPSRNDTHAMRWGREKENTALKAFELQLRVDGNTDKIERCGLFIDSIEPYLGATPDAVIGDTGIVEIKCPYSAMNVDPQDAIHTKVTEIARYFDKRDSSKMNLAHHYYYQVQGQLHITGKEYCYFVVWTERGLKYVKVTRDDAFWKTQMEPQLTRFYKYCLLPELVDGRYARRMPLREPDYVIDANRARLTATKHARKEHTTAVSLQGDAPRLTLRMKKTVLDGRIMWSIIDEHSSDRNHSSQIGNANANTSNTASDQTRQASPTILKKSVALKRNSRTAESATRENTRLGKCDTVTSERANIGPSKSTKRGTESGDSRMLSSSDAQIQPNERSWYQPMAKRARCEKSLSNVNRAPWTTIDTHDVIAQPIEFEAELLRNLNRNVPLVDIKRDVLSKDSLLNDSSIDAFTQVIRDNTEFDTQTTLFLAYQQFIQPVSSDRDLQIIGGNENRHWRCLYYENGQLSVYDSTGCKEYESMARDEKSYISLRYPQLQRRNITFPKVSRQPDGYSCGIYAAAYAMTIALGGDPSLENYSNDALLMRKHFVETISASELRPFPRR